MPRLLTDEEIETCLKPLEGWRHQGNFITKTFDFEDFMDGIGFIDRVAKVAEAQEHHPDIHVRYTRVKLEIQTHSEGGVTKWDIGLAKEIEKSLARRPSRVRRTNSL